MLRLQWAVVAAILCCSGIVLSSCNDSSENMTSDLTPLAAWQAGKVVTAEAVSDYGGVDKCFAAEPIPDGVWQSMQGRTYKENPDIGRDDLRHIRALHWDYDNQIHIGEMVCNKVIADRDNNSSCFCYHTIAGSTNLSKHARGLAVDINTLYNPYYKVLEDGTLLIQPATGEAYCDRDWDFPYKIDHDDLCFKLFTEAGFEWGGDWDNCKDYQHFELIE